MSIFTRPEARWAADLQGIQPGIEKDRPNSAGLNVCPASVRCGALVALLAIQGCASIVGGKRQDVHVWSEPTGATVFVDGIARGSTPAVLRMERGKAYTIRTDWPGGATASLRTTRGVSGWLLANLFFVPIFPVTMVIDAAAGAATTVAPSRLLAVFPSGGSAYIAERVWSHEQEGSRGMFNDQAKDFLKYSYVERPPSRAAGYRGWGTFLFITGMTSAMLGAVVNATVHQLGGGTPPAGTALLAGGGAAFLGGVTMVIYGFHLSGEVIHTP